MAATVAQTRKSIKAKRIDVPLELRSFFLSACTKDASFLFYSQRIPSGQSLVGIPFASTEADQSMYRQRVYWGAGE